MSCLAPGVIPGRQQAGVAFVRPRQRLAVRLRNDARVTSTAAAPCFGTHRLTHTDLGSCCGRLSAVQSGNQVHAKEGDTEWDPKPRAICPTFLVFSARCSPRKGVGLAAVLVAFEQDSTEEPTVRQIGLVAEWRKDFAPDQRAHLSGLSGNTRVQLQLASLNLALKACQDAGVEDIVIMSDRFENVAVGLADDVLDYKLDSSTAKHGIEVGTEGVEPDEELEWIQFLVTRPSQNVSFEERLLNHVPTSRDAGPNKFFHEIVCGKYWMTLCQELPMLSKHSKELREMYLS
ncbi:hypothetical protein WJX73_005486 [Symbiochloris irregularis]|uniref:Uncharacterized protein n=1 Tax=Symbiochloris irregularis TaxID=706552 RepID=A0AAW1PMY2_9CHLO